MLLRTYTLQMSETLQVRRPPARGSAPPMRFADPACPPLCRRGVAFLGRVQSFELIDDKELFVDCVRRIKFYSTAKLFVLDNLRYALSSASDGVCTDSPTQESVGSTESDAAATSAGSVAALPAGWQMLLSAGMACAFLASNGWRGYGRR